MEDNQREFMVWWEGDKRVEPFMCRVLAALERNNIKGKAKTDIYNRVYEAIHSVFIMYDELENGISKSGVKVKSDFVIPKYNNEF